MAHFSKRFSLPHQFPSSLYMQTFKNKLNQTDLHHRMNFDLDYANMLVQDDNKQGFEEVTIGEAMREGLFEDVPTNNWRIYSGLDCLLTNETGVLTDHDKDKFNEMMNEFFPVINHEKHVRNDNWDLIVHNDTVVGLKGYQYIYDRCNWEEGLIDDPDYEMISFYIALYAWNKNVGWVPLEDGIMLHRDPVHAFILK